MRPLWWRGRGRGRVNPNPTPNQAVAVAVHEAALVEGVVVKVSC